MLWNLVVAYSDLRYFNAGVVFYPVVEIVTFYSARFWNNFIWKIVKYVMGVYNVNIAKRG